MYRYSYPDFPVMTLSGNVHSLGSEGIDPYGISDSTGLGPNGSNVYRTYRTTIEDIEAQEHGDSSVRFGQGLHVGGQYDGIDVTVGDFITNQDATRIFKITDIYKKTRTSVDILYEDVWMSIAKSRADRVNKFSSGTTVVIFRVSEDNVPLISWTGDGYFTNPGSSTSSIDRLHTYFRVYQPSKHFTFYSATGADLLSIGDLITATGGTGESSLIKIDSPDQTVVGQIYQIFGGNNIIINSTGRIITNFPDPPGLTAGKIADTWYSDNSGGYNLTDTENRGVFFQLTNSIPTHVIGGTGPTFDQTNYNLIINGIEVIAQSPTGPTAMPFVDIINNINSNVSLTHTLASNDGGRLRLDRDDGGDIVTRGSWVTYDSVGRELYSTSRGTPPYVMLLDSNSEGIGGPTADFSLGVLDEGISVGNYTTMNFIGDEVYSEDSGIPGQVNVYILPPTFASHYGTTDGTTDGTISEILDRSIVRISTPTTEGSPYFKTNSWAGTNQAATISGTPVFSTAEEVTGFGPTGGGDSVINVNVYDADGIGLLASYTTPILNGNGTFISSGSNAGISVTLTNYGPDATKFKAEVSVSVNMDTIFTENGLDGGRYHIETEHITDTDTDGGVSYSHIQSDVFYDTNNSTPNINGFMTLIESTNPPSILTKHISGVEYYTLGSEFETTVTDIDDLNENTQGRNNSPGYNFRISAPEYGLPQRNLEAWNLSYGTWNGTWTNFWDLQNASYEYNTWPITATNYRYRGPFADGLAEVFDPWNPGNDTDSPDARILVDTFNDNSTRLGEDFDGESKRLRRGSSVYSSWDSVATLVNNSNETGSGTFCDACVVGSNLVRPDRFFLTDPSTSTIEPDLTLYKANKGGTNPDYSSHNNIAVFHRKFYTEFSNNDRAISSFVMTFGGSPAAYDDFSHALEQSALRVYVRRINIPTGQLVGTYGFNANPLSLHGPLFSSGAPANPFDDGASGVDTPGARIRTENGGNSVPGTFGTGSPAAEGFWMELQIIDPNIKIDYINVTLIFSNGDEDLVPV